MRWKKLVVRELPHDMTCEEALSVCGFPVTYTESALRTPIFPSVFFRWEAGKPSKNGRAMIPSQLYLQFRKDPDLLEETLGLLHGKEVTLANGSSIVLSVHVAPNQKLPREKRRRDNKMNTIDKDADFLAFVEELNDAEKKQMPVNPNILAPGTEGVDDKTKEKPISALVKFLNERRAERRDKGKFSRGNSSGFPAERKKKDGKGSKSKDKRKPKGDTDAGNGRPPKDTRGKKIKDKRRSSNPGDDTSFKSQPGDAPPRILQSMQMEMQPGMFRIMPKANIDSMEPPLPPPLPVDGMRYDDDNSSNGGRGGRGRGGRGGGRGKKERRDGEGRPPNANGGGRGGGKKKSGVFVPKGQQPPLPPAMG